MVSYGVCYVVVWECGRGTRLPSRSTVHGPASFHVRSEPRRMPADPTRVQRSPNLEDPAITRRIGRYSIKTPVRQIEIKRTYIVYGGNESRITSHNS